MNIVYIIFGVICCFLAILAFLYGYQHGYNKGVTDGYANYKHDILTGDQGNECMEGSFDK